MIRRPPPGREPRGRADTRARAVQPRHPEIEGMIVPAPPNPAWSGLPGPGGFRRDLLPGPDVVPS